MLALGASRAISFGKLSQTAGTAIVRTIPPMRNMFTHLAGFRYTAQGTAHVVTVMRPFGSSTLSAAAASGQAVVNITADAQAGTGGGALAANDYVVIEKPDGTYHTGVVSSVSTLAVTLTANVPAGGFSSGAVIWFFGVAADHTDAQFNGYASATTPYADRIGGVRGTTKKYEPLIIYSPNATAAGTLESASVVYAKDTGAVAA